MEIELTELQKEEIRKEIDLIEYPHCQFQINISGIMDHLLNEEIIDIWDHDLVDRSDEYMDLISKYLKDYILEKNPFLKCGHCGLKIQDASLMAYTSALGITHYECKRVFEKLRSILEPCLGNIENYDVIESEFIKRLIPAIHYFNDKVCISRIQSILTYSANHAYRIYYFENWSDFDNIEENILIEISTEIDKIRNDFSSLKYYNESGIELKDHDDFSKNAYQFMKDFPAPTNVAPLHYTVGNEYLQILNIVYHCNSFKEVIDVYNLFSILWGFIVDSEDIDPEAKITWENLSEWKIRMDKMLIKK
jgi:hypothetical protein